MKKLIILLSLSVYVCFLSLQAQISFVDKSVFAGLSGNQLNQGLALGDYDLDGREDLYVTATNGGPNRLYRNVGNFIFEDVSVPAGVGYSGTSKASCWGDIDNDGDPDLYVGNRDEEDLLFINQGNGTFLEESAARGILNPANTTSVNMADINKDGWLDIYLSNIQSPNLLFINDGTGHFTNQAAEAGVDDLAVGMGAVVFDYDLDGHLDIYQCHDAQIPYILYRNMGNGQFQNVSDDAKVNYAGFGMGVDAGDFNGDGHMDLYITNLYDNVLYQNMGDGTFENVAEAMHVNDEGMGWGNVFGDFDNDRLNDIYVSNDTYFSPLANILYRNAGNDFESVSEEDPCSSPYGGYATVASDLNDDGKLDILIANSGAPGVQLLQNTTPGDHHYIAFHLEGVVSNRDAVGARLEVHTSAGIQYDQVIGSSGFAGHNGRWIHFGLAGQNAIEKLIIYWPSGVVEQIDDLTADQKYSLREGEGVISATTDIRQTPGTCNLIYGSNETTIRFTSSPDVQLLRISDMSGKRIPASYSVLQDEVKIALPSLPAGIYQILVVQPDQSCATRFWHQGTVK